jgi:hypothetical protein
MCSPVKISEMSEGLKRPNYLQIIGNIAWTILTSATTDFVFIHTHSSALSTQYSASLILSISCVRFLTS